MKENQSLISLPSLGPTDGEPCTDCDDDNFSESEESNLDEQLRSLIRAVLLAS